MSQNATQQKEKPLSAKQQSLIAALVEGKSIRAASENVGIDAKTAHRWLKLPLFLKEYNEQKTRAYNEKLDTLRSGISTALRTLLTHMTSAETRPYVQVAAASKWLDVAIEVHKMQELEMRVIELEEKLKAGNK